MARNTNRSRKAAAAAKKVARDTQRILLATLCKCIFDVSENNEGKLPYGYMKKIVDENKKQLTWITRDTVNSAYKRYKKSILEDCTPG